MTHGSLRARARQTAIDSTPEPPEADRKNLTEWESNDGLVGFDGRASPAMQELRRVAERLRPELDRLGRIEPAGDAVERDRVVARVFRDLKDGSRLAILVNRDVERSRPVPRDLVASWGLSVVETLAPGDGRIVALPPR